MGLFKSSLSFLVQKRKAKIEEESLHYLIVFDFHVQQQCSMVKHPSFPSTGLCLIQFKLARGGSYKMQERHFIKVCNLVKGC